MTRMMGHRAAAKPSSAEVAQSTAGIFQMVRARTAAMARAARQALWPGIFSTASAMMSHTMGSRVRTDCRMGGMEIRPPFGSLGGYQLVLP